MVTCTHLLTYSFLLSCPVLTLSQIQPGSLNHHEKSFDLIVKNSLSVQPEVTADEWSPSPEKWPRHGSCAITVLRTPGLCMDNSLSTHWIVNGFQNQSTQGVKQSPQQLTGQKALSHFFYLSLRSICDRFRLILQFRF